MSHLYRPKFGARKDANHPHILKDLAGMVGGWWRVIGDDGSNLNAYTFNVSGWPVLLVDTSQAGGLTLDTRVYVGSLSMDVEIKQPDKRGDLTEGERLYFQLTPETGRIVTSADEYLEVIKELIDRQLWFTVPVLEPHG
jgi:hypothetical protein